MADRKRRSFSVLVQIYPYPSVNLIQAIRLLLPKQARCDFLHDTDISVVLKYRKQHIQPFSEIFKCSSLIGKFGNAFVLFGNDSIFLNYALLHFLHNAHIFLKKLVLCFKLKGKILNLLFLAVGKLLILPAFKLLNTEVFLQLGIFIYEQGIVLCGFQKILCKLIKHLSAVYYENVIFEFFLMTVDFRIY